MISDALLAIASVGNVTNRLRPAHTSDDKHAVSETILCLNPPHCTDRRFVVWPIERGEGGGRERKPRAPWTAVKQRDPKSEGGVVSVAEQLAF